MQLTEQRYHSKAFLTVGPSCFAIGGEVSLFASLERWNAWIACTTRSFTGLPLLEGAHAPASGAEAAAP